MIKLKLVIFLFFIFSISGFSQSFEDFLSGKYNNSDLSKFHVTIDNCNFIKNNEYFTDFADGYTLIGYFIKPRVVYKANEKVNFYIGIHLQKYFGTKKFDEFEPVFTVEYMPNKNITLVFGELYGTTNHNLPNIVLNNEHYFIRNSENGIQLIFDNKRIKSDTWLDWRQFIFKNSPFPEALLFGTANKFNIINYRNKHFLDIHISAVASHIGGQINSSNDPVETIMNTQSGIEYKFNLNNKFLENIKLFGHLISAIDASPEKRLSYENGYGLLSGIELSNKILDLKLQNWYGNKFFSKLGDPMFQSIPIKPDAHNQAKRLFTTAHIFWTKEAFDFLKIGAGADLYYDVKNSHLDYSFGVYIKTNLNFNFRKNKNI
jgi:hypothetical protein